MSKTPALLSGLVALGYVYFSNPANVEETISTVTSVANVWTTLSEQAENTPEAQGANLPTPEQIDGEIVIDGTRHPEAAKHAEEAQKAVHPVVATVDRAGADDRRRQSTNGTRTQKGKGRDEYPPAVAKEGGKGPRVRHINPADNRGAGASIGQQLKAFADGAKVVIKVIWTLVF